MKSLTILTKKTFKHFKPFTFPHFFSTTSDMDMAMLAYEKLNPDEKNAYQALLHTKPYPHGIIELSTENMNYIHTLKTEEAPPILTNHAIVAGHHTAEPYKVAHSNKLLSYQKLRNTSGNFYSCTKVSDEWSFNNRDFVFFNFYTQPVNPQISLHFPFQLIKEKGYTTLFDGHMLNKRNEAYCQQHEGDIEERYVNDALVFTHKNTGKTSSFSLSFTQSHVFGPHVPLFLEKLLQLKMDSIRKIAPNGAVPPETKQAVITHTLNTIEAKLPCEVTLDHLIDASESFKHVREEMNAANGSHQERVLIERAKRHSRENQEYQGKSFD